MDEILHHLGALNYCNSQDFRDLRWCKISSINSRCYKRSTLVVLKTDTREELPGSKVWGFPKIWGTLLGVPIIRDYQYFGGLY